MTDYFKEYPIIEETWGLVKNAQKDVNWLEKNAAEYGENLTISEILIGQVETLAQLHDDKQANIGKIVNFAKVRLNE